MPRRRTFHADEPASTTPVASVVWQGKVYALDIDIAQLEVAQPGHQLRAEVRFIRPSRLFSRAAPPQAPADTAGPA